jgi:hypothetical protein
MAFFVRDAVVSAALCKSEPFLALNDVSRLGKRVGTSGRLKIIYFRQSHFVSYEAKIER